MELISVGAHPYCILKYLIYKGVKMYKKMFILLFCLIMLISVSAVSAADLDDNNETVVASDMEVEKLSASNDVNAMDELNEDDAGSDDVLQSDAKSEAAGEKEILSVGYSDSDVLGAKGSKISIDEAYYQKIGSDYKIIVTGYVRDVDDDDINTGTVSIYLNDELKRYCDAEFGMFSGEVDVGPGSYNVGVHYHDDSGDYDDSQNNYYDNPIIIKPPEPTTWYVNGSKPYGGGGKSEADAFSTLNEALYAASNNDTVKFASGTYAGNANTGVYIQKILTFEKYGDGEAIFDGQGQGTIWSVGVDTINIYGLTFINGGGDKGGALYFLRDFSNSVINATFINNSVNFYGGAIYVDNSVSNLTLRSTFINNTANEDGAAVYIKNAASNLILNSTFIGNNGGDSIIYIGNSVSGNSIHDSVFLNNEAYKIFSVNNGEITAKNNWFGSNATNYYKIPEDVGIDLESWLFLNATADPSELAADEKSTIIFKLSSFDGSEIIDYDASKMNIILNLSQTLGQLDKTSASIGENITYTAKDSGNATVTGKFETASYTVNLTNADPRTPTSINVTNSTVELKVNEEIAAGATLTPADAGNLTYNSSNSSVAVVENGKIKALAAGSANITVSFAGDETYAPSSKTIAVTVTLNDASLSVNNATLNLLIDDEFVLVATTTPKGLNVTFTPDNSGVVSVDENGVVTALKQGTANVKVSVGGDGVYALNTTNVTVTVSKIPTEIIANATLNMSVGDVASNVASLKPSVAGNLTYVSGNSNVVRVENGKLIAVANGTALVNVNFAGNDKYEAAISKVINVTVSLRNAGVSVNDADLDLIVKDTFKLIATTVPEGLNVSYSSTNESVVTVDSNGTVTAVGTGKATIVVSVGDDKVYAVNSTNVTVTVKKATSITAADVSTTYKVNKDLIITLKDDTGKAIANVKVTVDLNGAKTYTTDKNGQVKVPTNGLAPKAYTAKVTFNGNDDYAKSTKNVTVTVKKATPKITAKTKTFKTTTKTKIYAIVLKNNINKAISKAKVYLKVGGKTYKATTNSKGKATFKITKLTKKGTFIATITYKGNTYYNKATKKVKIKVKAVWKTVSKGSKAKATVKKIQKALKKNGYYRQYSVDGIYQQKTFNAVKKFQKAKGLKVTGKVDEKTAKKLGII